ncbi:MAG: cupin domain-containing protein [Saprospiraceae bacterium]
MTKKIKSIIAHYQFDRIPLEGTFYKSTYVSKRTIENGPVGTAIIGLYCQAPLSVSCFHRLTHDEVWHFYKGQAFVLHLLHPNGEYQKVIMGNDVLQQQKVQFTIPAHVWQAAELLPESEYALFGCTMSPGFTGTCFEGGTIEFLSKNYPEQQEIIERLSVKGHETKLPEGYTQ